MWDIVKVRSSCQARIGLNTQYVGKQVNNIFDNLPNTDLDYDSAVKSFSDYFDQIRNKDMTIFDLRELKQEENKSLWKQIFQMAEDPKALTAIFTKNLEVTSIGRQDTHLQWRCSTQTLSQNHSQWQLYTRPINYHSFLHRQIQVGVSCVATH